MTEPWACRGRVIFAKVWVGVVVGYFEGYEVEGVLDKLFWVSWVREMSDIRALSRGV